MYRPRPPSGSDFATPQGLERNQVTAPTRRSYKRGDGAATIMMHAGEAEENERWVSPSTERSRLPWRVHKLRLNVQVLAFLFDKDGTISRSEPSALPGEPGSWPSQARWVRNSRSSDSESAMLGWPIDRGSRCWQQMPTDRPRTAFPRLGLGCLRPESPANPLADRRGCCANSYRPTPKVAPLLADCSRSAGCLGITTIRPMASSTS